MIQCFNIDRQTTLTGRLATGDVRFAMRVIQGGGKMRVVQGDEKPERGNKVMDQSEDKKEEEESKEDEEEKDDDDS